MFFKRFRQPKEEDRFAKQDLSNQLRPRINKGDYYREKGFDFCWLMIERLYDNYDRDKDHELSTRLSPGQKALYFWWYLDGQVSNGGFVQFYFNGYGHYVQAIIKGLHHIGDAEMANLVQEAHKIYLANKKIVDLAIKKDDFGGELYDRLEALSNFDDAYYDLTDSTMALMEKFARQHPNEFCLDEYGLEFVTGYTGRYTTTYENGNAKDEFYLVNGELEGEFISYFENGNTKTQHIFVAGEQVGEQIYWNENGSLRKRILIDGGTKSKRKESFYENGQMAKLEHTDEKDEKYGEYKEWHPNGQLKEQAIFISNSERIGHWEQFWDNGIKKLEAESRDETVLFHNAWDDTGKQLLKNGTGLYINEYEMEFITTKSLYKYENEYQNYKRHGISKSYTNGVLQSVNEYKNGVQDGISKSYDKDGNLEEEKIYKNGQLVSTNSFGK